MKNYSIFTYDRPRFDQTCPKPRNVPDAWQPVLGHYFGFVERSLLIEHPITYSAYRRQKHIEDFARAAGQECVLHVEGDLAIMAYVNGERAGQWDIGVARHTTERPLSKAYTILGENKYLVCDFG